MSERYTCHEDGSTDCPCLVAEKTTKLIGMTEGSQKFTIAPGEAKSFCTCGLSKNFPLCDGSHKAFNAAHGTTFKSIKIEVEETEPAKEVWICRCGHSKNKPFCDGSHKKIKAVPV